MDLSKFKYCGGNKGRHLAYFKLCLPNYEHPKDIYKCICGTIISQHIYLTDGDNIIIIGKCCEKKFKIERTCAKCSAPHRNSSVNICFICKNTCIKCNVTSKRLVGTACIKCIKKESITTK